ncbi:cupin domain-containing protein [Methylomicrobium sp. Wu6]|uniref:cupin domain-containing protein n=1 Tax=Methylomicrobium sp. Wu6 TaxID=3107928 RepID=UPI002DD64194|nr:cupin domain-containing protein [Methylomicrobium sp. Wu6]MEC4749918.1 cupin domain-containing protein [Methylomicrobium sp. Wu6]
MSIPPVFKKAAMLSSVLFVAQSHSAFAREASEIKRTVLLQQQATLPGPNVNGKVIRVDFPQGVKTPRHTHEGPGPRYVVKGTLQVVEGDKTGIYSEGEVFWETGQSMTVENIGGEPAELIIFEMGPGH